VDGPTAGSVARMKSELRRRIHAARSITLLGCAIAPIASSQEIIITHFGDVADDRLGRSVAGIGDVDGDALPDYAGGASRGDAGAAIDAGYIRAWSSATGSVLFTVYGDQACEYFGTSIAGIGDFDGDGIPDIAGGGPYRDNGGVADAGFVRVTSGSSGAVIAQLSGTQVFGLFGFTVQGAGDVDLDGICDLAIGAGFEDGSNGTDCGVVYVIAGGSHGVIRTHGGQTPFEEFGRALANGDFDGNGVVDLAIGAWHADQGGVDAGSAYQFSWTNGALMRIYSGDSPFDFFGISVDNVFDMDFDGLDDLIVGSHHDDPFGIESGSARVFSSANGAQLWKVDGEVPDMFFGRSVAGVGDVDGDEVPDFAAGTPFLGNAQGQNIGLERIFSGKTGHQLYQVDGDSVNDMFAFAVAGVGDIDGNGFTDFVVGARDDDDVATNCGSVRLFNGCSGRRIDAGGGTAGSGGFVPRIRIEGCPRVGATVGFHLDSALGGSLAMVILSAHVGSTPISSGLQLRLALPVISIAPILLPGTAPGQGEITATGLLPASAAGATLAVPCVIVDPLAVGGLALTNALELDID
jgi:hypothetical protein